MKHRPDIDGLRALAVVPVVLFHSNFSAFSGGYVGVDVFFVISGYLITSILHGELQAGRFSVLRFYERRVRRIFPALFAMLAATLVAAAVILMPDDLRAFGKYLVAATLFSANILFWRETDYFAAPAELNPLLHTWSLAIEEQYYIFFPLLLALAFRFARKWLVALLILASVASLAVSAWGVRSEPTGAFYLLPSRAWELLLGALLAVGAMPVFRRRVVNEGLAWAGLAAIIAGVFVYTSETPFPGFAALLPCLGAAALIQTGHARTIPARLLGLKPVAGIGLVSYSLYLWHWPLIVLAQYQLMREVEHWERWAVALISLMLAYVSWRFVEQPFRTPSGAVGRQRLFPTAFASMLAAIGVGGGFYALDGLPQRVPELAEIKTAQSEELSSPPDATCFVQTEKTYRDWTAEKCLLAGNGWRRALLWGDSHANQYAAGLRAAASEVPMSILLYSSAGCAPVFDGAFSSRPNCNEFNEHVTDVIKSQGISTIILAAYWEKHLELGNFAMSDLDRTVERLRRLVPNVIVIGQLPTHSYRNPIQVALRRDKAGDHAPEYYVAPINRGEFSRLFAPTLSKAFLIDPAAALCRDQRCLYMLGDNLLYRDNNHLSPFGSRYVVEREIAPRLKAILEQMDRTSRASSPVTTQ